MRIKTIWCQPVDAEWTDGIDADTQVTAEEAIAFALFDASQESEDGMITEEGAHDLARTILLMIACELRPDLLTITGDNPRLVRS